MDDFYIRMMDAAEACFESDPSPKNVSWIENLVQHLVQHETKKSARCNTGATLKIQKNIKEYNKTK